MNVGLSKQGPDSEGTHFEVRWWGTAARGEVWFGIEPCRVSSGLMTSAESSEKGPIHPDVG